MKYIAVDIDDTLNDFSETLKTSLEFTYGNQDVYDEYIDMVRNDVFEEGNDELDNLRDSIHLQCYTLSKARTDAVDFMQDLKAEGWTIVILTARTLTHCINDTKAWLGEVLMSNEELSIIDFVRKYADVMTVSMLMDYCKLHGIKPSSLFDAELIEFK